MNKHLNSIPKKTKGSFSLTLLNSQSVVFQKRYAFIGIKTTSYKSNNVNAQQFYKPISKIIQL